MSKKSKSEEIVNEQNLSEILVNGIFPEVKAKILKEIDAITPNLITVEVVKEGEKVREVTDIVHKEFKNILTLVNNNIPVMLTGGAGSGKSSTCEKVAETLGLDFYFSNAITQEYKLTGFIDAHGKYQETQFYKAFKDGGLFVLDKIDASLPEALVVINTAIANGYFDFPCGKVEAHKDFRIVACANTYGLGGNDVYVGRYQLDGASLDRFATIYFDYDYELEKGLVKNVEWAEFIQQLRNRIKEKQIKHIVSMRATIYGDKLIEAGVPTETIFNEIVFKNLGRDDIKTLGLLDDYGNRFIEAYNDLSFFRPY